MIPEHHPSSCRQCKFYSHDGLEGYDYFWPACDKDSRLGNLKSFPFKTERPCFESGGEESETDEK